MLTAALAAPRPGPKRNASRALPHVADVFAAAGRTDLLELSVSGTRALTARRGHELNVASSRRAMPVSANRGNEVGARSGSRASTKAGLAVDDGASFANRQGRGDEWLLPLGGRDQAKIKQTRKTAATSDHQRTLEPLFYRHTRPAETTDHTPDRLCKQEVTGSIPVGSTREVPASGPLSLRLKVVRVPRT